MSTTRDLGATLAGYDRIWPTLTDTEKAETRARWVADGWKICDHTDCPPWSCAQ